MYSMGNMTDEMEAKLRQHFINVQTIQEFSEALDSLENEFGGDNDHHGGGEDRMFYEALETVIRMTGENFGENIENTPVD